MLTFSLTILSGPASASSGREITFLTVITILSEEESLPSDTVHVMVICVSCITPGAVTVILGVFAIWIDGLDFVWDTVGTAWQDTSGVMNAFGGEEPDNIIISNCTFTDYETAIIDWYLGTRWVVMDNTIVGDKAVGVGTAGPSDFTGAGVDLNIQTDNHVGNHVVAYNSITRVGDGINTKGNCDVYGNQVWDCSDDGLEFDGGFENARFWGNRVHEVWGSTLSFQPQKAGPWYFLYNQCAVSNLPMWKWRWQDNIVWVNNTFVGSTLNGQHFMRGFNRNNLWVPDGAPVWSSTDESDTSPELYREPLTGWVAGWQTDSDYNGFDRGGSGNFFLWEDNATGYSTIASFASAVGMESNSIEVDASTQLDGFGSITETTDLTPSSGSNSIVDGGQEVANLADFYGGTAPDLGCHDRANGALHFGPREAGELSTKTEHWTKH